MKSSLALISLPLHNSLKHYGKQETIESPNEVF